MAARRLQGERLRKLLRRLRRKGLPAPRAGLPDRGGPGGGAPLVRPPEWARGDEGWPDDKERFGNLPWIFGGPEHYREIGAGWGAGHEDVDLVFYASEKDLGLADDRGESLVEFRARFTYGGLDGGTGRPRRPGRTVVSSQRLDRPSLGRPSRVLGLKYPPGCRISFRFAVRGTICWAMRSYRLTYLREIRITITRNFSRLHRGNTKRLRDLGARNRRFAIYSARVGRPWRSAHAVDGRDAPSLRPVREELGVGGAGPGSR